MLPITFGVLFNQISYIFIQNSIGESFQKQTLIKSIQCCICIPGTAHSLKGGGEGVLKGLFKHFQNASIFSVANFNHFIQF